MGSKAIFAGTINPPRNGVFKTLQAVPDSWEAECMTLQSSLRDALAELQRLNLVVAENDAIITALKGALIEVNRVNLMLAAEKDAIIARLRNDLEKARRLEQRL